MRKSFKKVVLRRNNTWLECGAKIWSEEEVNQTFNFNRNLAIIITKQKDNETKQK